MRCRPSELLVVAALLASAGARAAPEAPDLAAATGDRAAFASFVATCASTLAPADRGLARVARACPGIDVVLADGPFANSLPATWAGQVDAAMLERLRDVARSFEAAAVPARRLRREALATQLRELRADFRRPVGLWERFLAWYEELTRRREEQDDPTWLREFLARLGLAEADGRWIETAIYVLAVGLVLALLVAEARAHGWWARLRALAGRRETPRPPPIRAPGPVHADDPVAELALRFGARLGELHAAGYVPRPLTITCRELERLAGARAAPALTAVLRAAPVVEAARYAPRPPALAEIETALALLAAPTPVAAATGPSA